MPISEGVWLLAVPNTTLSVVISITVVSSGQVSVNSVLSWTPFYTNSCSRLVVGIREKRAATGALVGDVVSKVIERCGIAQIHTGVVVVICPPEGSTASVIVVAGISAVDRVVEANSRNVVRPGPIRTLQNTPSSSIVGKSLIVDSCDFSRTVLDTCPVIVLAEVGRRTDRHAKHDRLVSRTVIGPQRSGVF